VYNLNTMIEYEEKVERERPHTENPFQLVTVNEGFTVVGNLRKISNLDDNGRVVLFYVVLNLNQHDNTTTLEVVDICKREFLDYPKYDSNNQESVRIANTRQVYIRRGIKNLLTHKVIAKTTTKNKYWVNKSVIWR